ncbi:hypothetical protein niasHT_031802 [Heterodera trifolii]|uniref:Uncharacterized protein n=1 Tax=Heterodera trifolii TaxID=157864 RepID=A0ABD2J1K9_9BILA
MAFDLPLLITVLIIAITSMWATTNAEEYYGVPLGSLRNGTLGISGNVWLANSSAIQITDFKLDKNQKHETLFAFASPDAKIEAVKSLYKVIIDENGEEALTPMSGKKKHLGAISETAEEPQQRLVVMAPAGKNINNFRQFGVVNGKTMVCLFGTN